MKACPFCKSKKVSLIGGAPWNIRVYWVHCDACHSEGPMHGKRKAIAKWNEAKR